MTTPLELSIRLLEVLPPIVHHIRARARDAVKGRISLPQFRILAQIDRGISTVGELADLQSVAQPTMSKMVDGLFKRGLLKRKIGKSDRRQTNLELTKKGRSSLSQARNSLQNHLSLDLEGLSKSQLQSLSLALSHLDILKQEFQWASKSRVA